VFRGSGSTTASYRSLVGIQSNLDLLDMVVIVRILTAGILGHSHAAELLLNFSYGPHHAMGTKGLNPILSYLAVYFSLEYLAK
jgi:hypothetical protein